MGGSASQRLSPGRHATVSARAMAAAMVSSVMVGAGSVIPPCRAACALEASMVAAGALTPRGVSLVIEGRMRPSLLTEFCARFALPGLGTSQPYPMSPGERALGWGDARISTGG